MTWRRFTDLIWSGQDLAQQITVYPLVGVTRADYEVEGTVAGQRRGHWRLHASSTSRRANRACRPGNGSEFRNRPDYPSSISASRCRRPSGCRTSGWRASASRPTVTPRSLRQRRGAPGSGTVDDVAEHRRRRVRHRHDGQRQERDLFDPAALPDHRVGSVSVPVGHQCRGQSRRARRLRHAVLRAGRIGRSGAAGKARAARRSAREPPARRRRRSICAARSRSCSAAASWC